MSYNPNIPQPTDALNQSQGQIKANFQAINTVFSKNHAALNRESQGMHDLLLYRLQTVDPTTSATQIALYTKAVSTVPNLFFRPRNNQTPIQLTYPSIKADSSATQYTFCAGPFVIYGGLLTACVQNQLVTLTPATTLVYVGFAAIHSKDNSILIFENVCATNIVGNSFNVQFSNSSVPLNIYYMAIGM